MESICKALPSDLLSIPSRFCVEMYATAAAHCLRLVERCRFDLPDNVSKLTGLSAVQLQHQLHSEPTKRYLDCLGRVLRLLQFLDKTFWFRFDLLIFFQLQERIRGFAEEIASKQVSMSGIRLLARNLNVFRAVLDWVQARATAFFLSFVSLLF